MHIWIITKKSMCNKKEPENDMMLIMRKLLVIMILAACLGLTACDPVHFGYKYEDLSGNVSRVELIRYDNPEVAMINSFFTLRGLRDFDLDKMEIVEVLKEDEMIVFFVALTSIELWNMWSHPNSPAGICIRLVYDNDEFEVLSYHTIDSGHNSLIMRYDKKGKIVKYIGSFYEREEALGIVNDYFLTEIE